MKRTIIIFALIGISISAATTATAQGKGRKPVRQSIHDGAPATQPKAAGTGRVSNITDGTSNTLMGAARKQSITIGGSRTESRSNVLSGTPTANGTFNRRANAATFEGNDEPLWAKGGPATAVGTAQNVGPQINGNVRPKGFANTTFDDQAARSSQVVQGNQIGTSVRPRRTGLAGDFNGDSDVDATDYALKGSSSKTTVPSRPRSGITGGDFNSDGPTTVGRSSLNNTGRPQSLSAGTYGRGNRR